MGSELRNRWSIEHNLLSGITFSRWWSILRANDVAVDGAYLHRAVFLTGMSAFNSACAWVEDLRCKKSIEEASPAQPPLFSATGGAAPLICTTCWLRTSIRFRIPIPIKS